MRFRVATVTHTKNSFPWSSAPVPIVTHTISRETPSGISAAARGRCDASRPCRSACGSLWIEEALARTRMNRAATHHMSLLEARLAHPKRDAPGTAPGAGASTNGGFASGRRADWPLPVSGARRAAPSGGAHGRRVRVRGVPGSPRSAALRPAFLVRASPRASVCGVPSFRRPHSRARRARAGAGPAGLAAASSGTEMRIAALGADGAAGEGGLRHRKRACMPHVYS